MPRGRPQRPRAKSLSNLFELMRDKKIAADRATRNRQQFETFGTKTRVYREIFTETGVNRSIYRPSFVRRPSGWTPLLRQRRHGTAALPRPFARGGQRRHNLLRSLPPPRIAEVIFETNRRVSASPADDVEFSTRDAKILK
jgi:hypothetical protein